MKKSRLRGAVCAVLLTLITTSSHAVLQSRLGGLAYYDTDANMTWLADADAAGAAVHWSAADTLAAGLNVAGVTGWRLPDTLQPDSSCVEQTGGGWPGANCTGSEMGNMFYNVLGGVAGNSIATTHNSNYDLFTNIHTHKYWSATEYAPDDSYAWDFYFFNGDQDFDDKNSDFFVWAVHDGDVSAVPIPPALWLFGSGLLGLVGMARRKL